MLFSHLDADVLSHIFALTDVYTILSLGQVNKYFHEISSAKHLWIAIVRGLALRRLVDAPSDEVLETLSKNALVDEVRRVVCGPSTWSLTSLDPPMLSRQTTISLQYPYRHAELLPGGMHIVFSWAGAMGEGFQCWDVHAHRQVWSWERPGRQAREAKFDFRAGESEAVVALVVSTEIANNYEILVLDVNLTTGDSHDLFHLPTGDGFPTDMQISGDFLAFRATVYWFVDLRSFVVLVNWRTADVIVFYLVSQESNFSLLPDHIILVCPGATWGIPAHLRLYSISSLSSLWHPMDHLDVATYIIAVNLGDIPFVTCNIPASHRNHDLWGNLSISVVPSPIHDAAYDCVVEVITSRHQPPPRPTCLLARLRSRLRSRPIRSSPITTIVTRAHFTFSLPSPQFVPTSVVHHQKDLPLTARSRYDWVVRDGLPIVVHGRDETEVARGRDLPGMRGASHVRLVHSGAVLAIYPSQAVVSYYR
ncbi:hypothetical protein C8F04DRAFT_1116508 [Mycena alexandri]|uniref:F-box domain-containing protein n=1 Tax=Mycena alexandri TaxID=1745969 RepID=A0AAD6WZQ5_9AGAR|nr:hypothetical protein C8F04DRAFT_1116508 [Mycena alexandri]